MITKTGLLMVHLMQAVMQVGREAIKMSTIEHDNHEKMIKILRFPACSFIQNCQQDVQDQILARQRIYKSTLRCKKCDKLASKQDLSKMYKVIN